MKRSSQLDQYKRFVGEDVLAQIYRAAESLAGLHVLHVNTTAQGGGVAELLHSLIPLMDELGIPHSWKVIPLDEASNLFAAHLVDLLLLCLCEKLVYTFEENYRYLAGQR